MSVGYYLVSDTEAIQIAQVGGGGFTLYYGEIECMKALRLFLEKNMLERTPLRLLNENDVWELEGAGTVTEIEWKPNHMVDE